MTIQLQPATAPVSVLPSEPVRPVSVPVQQVSAERPNETKDQPSGAKSESPREGADSAGSTSQSSQAQMEAVIAQLRARDREVHAHEMAHLAAAGGFATSGAHYTYQTGPDGRRYAIGGEVGIDISPEADPEKTLIKMQIVQRAALAPANPSPQDMRVAAAAAQAMAEARMELARQQLDGEGAQRQTDAVEKAGIRAEEESGGDGGSDSDELPLVAAGLAARNDWVQRLAIQRNI